MYISVLRELIVYILLLSSIHVYHQIKHKHYAVMHAIVFYENDSWFKGFLPQALFANYYFFIYLYFVSFNHIYNLSFDSLNIVLK